MDMPPLHVRYLWGTFLPQESKWYYLNLYLYTMEQVAWGTWVSCSYAFAYRICQRFDKLLISAGFIIIRLLPPICSSLARNTAMDVMQYSTWLEFIHGLSSQKWNQLLLKSLGKWYLVINPHMSRQLVRWGQLWHERTIIQQTTTWIFRYLFLRNGPEDNYSSEDD